MSLYKLMSSFVTKTHARTLNITPAFILICWLGAQETYLIINVENNVFFSGLLDKKKVQTNSIYFKMEILYNKSLLSIL